MWMKHRVMWASGYGSWEWRLLNEGSLEEDRAERWAESAAEELSLEHDWSDKFRKIEYEVHSEAPTEVIEEEISRAEKIVASWSKRLAYLKELREPCFTNSP